MIPKTKLYSRAEVLGVVNEIEQKDLEVEVSELLNHNEVYLCAYKQDHGIVKEYLFDLSWDELTGILDENNIEYFESRS